MNATEQNSAQQQVADMPADDPACKSDKSRGWEVDRDKGRNLFWPGSPGERGWRDHGSPVWLETGEG